jgi:hypothetical protein
MITPKEHQKYTTKSSEEPRTLLCYHCNKLIIYRETGYYYIAMVPSGASSMDVVRPLYFHNKCFNMIASERYMMEEY